MSPTRAAVPTNAAAPAAATGFAQIGVTTGAALGPLGFGFVAADLGSTAAWSMTAAFALLGGAALVRAASAT
jgi:hypothetical protein